MKSYKFIKTGQGWFIDLPEFIEQGGSEGDLQMVEGADTMLDTIAKGSNNVQLIISKEPFEGADKLILTEKCDPYVGGGYYLLKYYNGIEINQTIWLCGVVEFVFKEVPQEIYLKRAA